jgi:hypothetical protein
MVVFGVGYVVGSHAGRERYDRIKAFGEGLAGRLEERVRDGLNGDDEGAEPADETETASAA